MISPLGGYIRVCSSVNENKIETIHTPFTLNTVPKRAANATRTHCPTVAAWHRNERYVDNSSLKRCAHRVEYADERQVNAWACGQRAARGDCSPQSNHPSVCESWAWVAFSEGRLSGGSKGEGVRRGLEEGTRCLWGPPNLPRDVKIQPWGVASI